MSVLRLSRIRRQMILSRTGRKRRRREAETDGLSDGTDFIASFTRQDNPVNTGKLISHNLKRMYTLDNSNCMRHAAVHHNAVHILNDTIIIIIHTALFD